MKKAVSIFFIIFYITFTIGITVSTHFCGGKITSVQMSINTPKENPCGCKDSATQGDCCKTEVKSIQLKDEQIAVHVDQPSSLQTDVNIWADASNDKTFASNLFHIVLPATSPPDSHPSYILHCTLLI